MNDLGALLWCQDLHEQLNSLHRGHVPYDLLKQGLLFLIEESNNYFIVWIVGVERVLQSIYQASDLQCFGRFTCILVHRRRDICPLTCFGQQVLQNFHFVSRLRLED